MKLTTPNYPFIQELTRCIQELTRCIMICITCIGGQIWNMILPNTSQNVTFVEGFGWTICIHLDFYNPCLSLFRNRRIFPRTLLWVCPARQRGMTLFGSLWIALPSLLIFFLWIPGIQPRSMSSCILTGLWPCMEFLLLSSLIEAQSLSLVFGSNSRNLLVLLSSEV